MSSLWAFSILKFEVHLAYLKGSEIRREGDVIGILFNVPFCRAVGNKKTHAWVTAQLVSQPSLLCNCVIKVRFPCHVFPNCSSNFDTNTNKQHSFKHFHRKFIFNRNVNTKIVLATNRNIPLLTQIISVFGFSGVVVGFWGGGGRFTVWKANAFHTYQMLFYEQFHLVQSLFFPLWKFGKKISPSPALFHPYP